MFDKDYSMWKAYANSKLALLMFAEELQHRLDREKSSVIVNSANPGEDHLLHLKAGSLASSRNRYLSFFDMVGVQTFVPSTVARDARGIPPPEMPSI